MTTTNNKSAVKSATEVPPSELTTIEIDTEHMTDMQQMALQMVMGEGGLRERDRVIAIVQTSFLLTDCQKDGLLREIVPQKEETEGGTA